jgi:multidrug resistance efflux pump
MKILALLFAIVFYFGFVLHTTFSTPSKAKAKVQPDLAYVSAQASAPQTAGL